MNRNENSVVTLHDLLDHDARSFSSAETILKRNLVGWIDRADSIKLKAILQKYAEHIDQHLQKFEIFFEEEQFTYLNSSNRVMLAFVEETNEKLSLCADAAIRDACLLAAIQSITHFKISAYGTAAAFAKELQMEKQAALFYEAEVNEKQIDDRLSQLATYEINLMARTPVILPG